MRLADPLDLNLFQAPGYYALALRAIGQDLAKLAPCDLEIETQADGFVVRGHCSKQRLDVTTAKTQEPTLTEAIGKLFRQAAVPAATQRQTKIVEFSRIYDSQEINRLDQSAASYRTGMNRIPDPRTLGECLRTIGRLIDGNNCRLTSIKKFPDHLVVEYRDPQGQHQTEELTNFEIDKLQRRYYGSRGSFNPIDMWKGREI